MRSETGHNRIIPFKRSSPGWPLSVGRNLFDLTKERGAEKFPLASVKLLCISQRKLSSLHYKREMNMKWLTAPDSTKATKKAKEPSSGWLAIGNIPESSHHQRNNGRAQMVLVQGRRQTDVFGIPGSLSVTPSHRLCRLSQSRKPWVEVAPTLPLNSLVKRWQTSLRSLSGRDMLLVG